MFALICNSASRIREANVPMRGSECTEDKHTFHLCLGMPPVLQRHTLFKVEWKLLSLSRMNINNLILHLNLFSFCRVIMIFCAQMQQL